MGGRGVPQNFFLMGILLFMLLGSPRINLEPFDKPFWNIFENSPFSGQNRVNWGGGGRGVPEICFSLECSYFCYLGGHAKILNPSCLFSGRKVRASKKEK